MHPVLFALPWGPANAYGTLILLGGVLTIPGVTWDARARGLAGSPAGGLTGMRLASFVVDFYLVLVFGAAIGGRVLHIATAPGPYLEDPARMLAPENAGFVFFGSLLAIVGGWVWLARRYGLAFGSLVDLGATWMPLGHAFGRLGCLFAGCCWGAPWLGPTPGLGVRFPDGSVVHATGLVPHEGTHTIALHPVQLYEAVGLAITFAILFAVRRRRGIEAPYRQASRYALAYGIVRTMTEVVRSDASRGLLLELHVPRLAEALALPPAQPLALSISQAIAIALLGLGAWGLRRTRPRAAP